jgi:hypothetical protein
MKRVFVLMSVIGSILLTVSNTSGQRPKDGKGRPTEAITMVPPTYDFDDGHHVIGADFKYVLPAARVTIVIPKGFVTDYASIPPIARPFMREGLSHNLPGVVHDYLYWRQSCGKDYADRLFLMALQHSGVPYMYRWVMYGAVRSRFGDNAWMQNQRERKDRMPRIIPPERIPFPSPNTWKRFRVGLRNDSVDLDAPDNKPPSYCSGRLNPQ